MPKGYYGTHDKLARDLFNQPDYGSLNPSQQDHVSRKEFALRNPAQAHPYTQKGFTFGQARHVLMGLYRLQSAAGSYPQEIRAKISELSDALELDIAEAAKRNGFYPEYAAPLKAIKNALLNSRQPAGIPSTTNFGRPPMNGERSNGNRNSQPRNDAALNAQLDITRDASIANIRTQSEETRQQYRDEAARIESQKQRSAEVVQSNINAALDNRAIAAEANYQQAIQNAQAVETAAFQNLEGPKVFNYNHLNGLPLNQHADIVRTSQELLKARDVYLETHPEQRNNPAHQARIGEDGFVKFGPELQGQIEIASPDEARAMPLDELRRTVQRPNQRQVNPNEPLVTFIDQPDGTFDGTCHRGNLHGFKANRKPGRNPQTG